VRGACAWSHWRLVISRFDGSSHFFWGAERSPGGAGLRQVDRRALSAAGATPAVGAAGAAGAPRALARHRQSQRGSATAAVPQRRSQRRGRAAGAAPRGRPRSRR